MMSFFLFGGVRVLAPDDTEIYLGRKQQQLLTVLILAANRTVPADVLVDYVWGEDLPTNPVNSLQDLVKRVRIALGDDRHSIIVTRNKEYGLVADLDFIDVAIFRRLASAGLALVKAEPAAARLLLTHALDYAVGDLPDIARVSRVGEEIDDLYTLRKAAGSALEQINSGNEAGQALDDDGLATLSPPLVCLVLRLAEVGELTLADLVDNVTRHQGRIHRLSQGLLLASFPGGGAALRSAAAIADPLSGEPQALLGGALSQIPSGGNIFPSGGNNLAMERLLQLAGRASHGQILVSRTVQDSASTPRLKELLQPVEEDLWQIGQSVAGSTESPPHSEVAMVGRDQTIADILELIQRHRLVTLRGPGGIGKTRIARELAGILTDQFADGVSIVDLAEADRHGDPISWVVRTLALVPEPYRRPLDTLVDRLAESERLLILDNCEEFVEDLRCLSEAVISGCTGITMLATSRSALGAAYEAVYDIGELDIADAAQLLVSLAFSQKYAARPDSFDSRILKLCTHLDSVPLALECAASMVRAMGLEEATTALASLPDGAVLPLLDAAHGGRGRHRSIELALNVSCRSLHEEDVRLFERLSSLRGSFSSEDAAGVASSPGFEIISAGLDRLCEASLVKRLSSGQWRMLEPVRQFAATRLLRRGEQAVQAARHARHFVALAEKAAGDLRGPDEALWFTKLTEAYPNLVKALSWAVEAGDATAALKLTSSLWWYWAAQGMFVEGSEAVERALAVEGEAPRAIRAKALVAASHLAWWAGNSHRTETSLTEAMKLFTPREPDNREMISLEAWARTGLPAARMWGGGDYEELNSNLEEGLRLFTHMGDVAGAGLNLVTHSGIAWHYGDDELHYSKGQESLGAFQSAGHQTMIAHAKRVVGLAMAGLGDPDAGRPHVIEGLRHSEDLGDIGGLPLGLCFLGLLEVWAGDRLGAIRAFRQSIVVNRNLGQIWPSVLAIGFASEEASLHHRPADSVKLNAAVDALTNLTRIRLPPRDRLRVQSALERATHMLTADEETKARQEGSEMELPHAVMLALDVFDESAAET